MFLELSQSRDYLQVNIRPLVKAAKKEGISLRLIFEGHGYQSITFNLSHQGPIFEKSSIHMVCYASKDDKLTSFRTYLDLDAPIDVKTTLESINQQLNDSPTSIDSSNDLEFKFKHLTSKSIDEALINEEILELTELFRSRFLIDAPKKMLYEADLRRGIVFQAYWDEHHTLHHIEHSYFGLRTKLRTEQVFINTEYNGNTLRELRLLPIRQQVSPFWHKKIEDIELNELPKCIILSSLCLLKFAKLLRQEIKLGNDLLWDWLTDLSPDQAYPLRGLAIESIDKKHPMKSTFNRYFKTKEHKPGSLETPLEDILNAKEWVSDEALFIQDVHLEVDGDHFWATNLGSVIHMSRESSHKILKGQLEFKLDGEIIQGAQSSSKRQWFFPYGEHKPYYCPQFAILKDMTLSCKNYSY